jgi:[protein-PII] uridylyltransferase
MGATSCVPDRLSYDIDAMVDHRGMLEVGRFAIRWRDLGAQELECVIVSPDQTGLLAHVAGSLALVGFDIRDAAAYTQSDGRALEIYRGFDRFGRLADAVARDDASDMIRRSVMGEVQLDDELRQRVARYRAARRGGRRDEVVVTIDLEGSDFATIVEIHADDEIGVLARVARTIADFELDVSTAKVATLGDRVVDVFYVRDATGAKLGDVGEIARLRGALVACLRDDEPPPSST